LLDRSVTLFATTKQPGQGTGLGLSIVRQIVQAENGRFELTSTPGQGTIATVWFPVVEFPLEEEPEALRASWE
jgi:signal transduction histidine kinase